MHILLLDMDGVLLEPGGYHHALQHTIGRLGRLLGYLHAHLPQDTIHLFEAAGVTNEWDSSAICAALMLAETADLEPAPELPAAPPWLEAALHGRPLPDFAAFARRLAAEAAAGRAPRVVAALLLAGQFNLSPLRAAAIAALLEAAYNIHHSPTQRIFQEYILGSRQFGESYGLEAVMGVESYLTRYDRPAVTAETRAQLLAWLVQPAHQAIIFTNRPSLAVDSFFCTPEAELGARLVGLEGLPILGSGGLFWLAAGRGGSDDPLQKPSPVHALAALRLATGAPLAEALTEAARLALDGRDDGRWHVLDGVRVTVFEDAIIGLQSVLAAADILHRSGVHLDVQLVGISRNASKQAALVGVGAAVYPDLDAALGVMLET